MIPNIWVSMVSTIRRGEPRFVYDETAAKNFARGILTSLSLESTVVGEETLDDAVFKLAHAMRDQSDGKWLKRNGADPNILVGSSRVTWYDPKFGGGAVDGTGDSFYLTDIWKRTLIKTASNRFHFIIERFDYEAVARQQSLEQTRRNLAAEEEKKRAQVEKGKIIKDRAAKGLCTNCGRRVWFFQRTMRYHPNTHKNCKERY